MSRWSTQPSELATPATPGCDWPARAPRRHIARPRKQCKPCFRALERRGYGSRLIFDYFVRNLMGYEVPEYTFTGVADPLANMRRRKLLVL